MRAAVEGAEVRVLRAELLEAHRELSRLRSQNEQLMGSNRDLSSLLVTTDKRSGELVKIIVAFRRLLESDDSAAALRSVEEILINVIGTEDFVVLLIHESGGLQTVGGMGPAVEHTRRNTPTLEELHAEAHRFVPLYIADAVVGAIAIQELLPHRDLLNATDDQVLQLLSRYAATVMMSANLRRDWTFVNVTEVS
jgi:hypothetical protein